MDLTILLPVAYFLVLGFLLWLVWPIFIGAIFLPTPPDVVETMLSIADVGDGDVLYDLGSGLNVYKVKALRSDDYLKFPNSLVFNYHMILNAVATGQNFKFFPLTWREEDQVTNVRLFRQGWRMFGILRDFLFRRDKFLGEWHEPSRQYATKVIAGRARPCSGDSHFALRAA